MTWDEWIFLGATHDGSELRIFINGVDQGSPGTASGTIDQGSASVLLSINSSAGVDGLIAHYHVYSEAISEAEMRQIMHCPGSVRENLIGYWPLNDSSTQYNYAPGSPSSRHNGANALLVRLRSQGIADRRDPCPPSDRGQRALRAGGVPINRFTR